MYEHVASYLYNYHLNVDHLCQQPPCLTDEVPPPTLLRDPLCTIKGLILSVAPVVCEGPWGHCVIAPIGPSTLLMIEPRQRNRKCWQFHWWNHLANISSHTLLKYSTTESSYLAFFIWDENTCANKPLASSMEFPPQHHKETYTMLYT